MAYVSPFEDAPVADKAQIKEASGANDNVLKRSLRGGVYGAGSQLLSAGAGVADAVSDGAGAGLHTKSQSLRDMAALPGNASRVGSYEQLSNDFSMGNLGEYVGGLVGGSLPSTALGIAGGMLTGGAGVIPAMLGAGAATLPLNMGEVIQKQQADPQAMQQGAGQRALEALGGGLGASAVESLVPGLVGRQILGKGMANLGKESIKQIVGRNAMDIPLEGLTEGTGTAIKQYAANQDKDLDWNEIKEGAIGGAAAGSVFSGVGTASDLAHSVAPTAGNALSSAGTALKDRFEGAKGTVGDAADAVAGTAAGKKVKSLSDDLMDMVSKGKTKAEDLVGKVMRGEELGVDPAEWARATTDEAKARLTAMADSKGVEVATKWAKEMMDDVGLDAGKRQEVADTLANVAEKGGQVAMAGLRQTWEAGKKAAGLVSRFADSFNAQRTKRARADVDVDASFVDEPAVGVDYNNIPAWVPQNIREAYKDRPDAMAEYIKSMQRPAAAGAAEDVTDAAPKPSMNARREFIAKAVESGMTPDDARAAYIESLNGPRKDVGEPPKYSMDDSGAREVVMSALESSGLSQKRPELFNNSESINTMASGLLSMVSGMTRGQLSTEQVSNAISVFGEATSSVMTSMRSALLADATPAETESFFRNLNEIDTIQKRSNGIYNVMRRAFTDEASRTEAFYRIEEDSRLLIAHARGQFDAKSGAKPTAEQAYMNTMVNDFYTSNFGDKADLVRAAVEAEAAPAKADRVGAATAKEYDEDGQVIKADDTAGENSRDPLTSKFDEQGNRLEEAETSAMKFGLSKPDTRGNSKSALNGAAMLEGSRYAKQHMLDLKAAYPDQDVRFEKLPDSEYGHIVVEQRGDPSEFNAQDLADMTLDTKKYPKSPSRIDIGGHIIDAVKVAKFARNKMQDKWEGDTPTSKKQRLIDGFKQGIAQLNQQFGEGSTTPDRQALDRNGNPIAGRTVPVYDGGIQISDAAVIGFVGNEPLTWGQVKAEEKKVRSDTAADRMSANGKAKLAALRAEYRKATPADKVLIEGEVLNLVEFEKDRELTAGGDTQERSTPRAKAQIAGATIRRGETESNVSAIRTQSRAQDTQWSGDSPRAASARKQYDQRQDGKDVTPFEENDSRFGKDGMLTREGARMMLEGDADGGIDVGAPSSALHELDRKGTSSGDGRREVGLDENIHLNTAVNGTGDSSPLFGGNDAKRVIRGADGKVLSQRGPQAELNVKGVEGSRVGSTTSVGRTANMDGSGQYAQSRAVEGLNTLTMVINDSWSQVKTAGAKAVTQRAKTLINNANLLSAADLRKLQSLAPDPVKGVRNVPAASVADAREVINELARKYQDVIVAPTAGRAGAPHYVQNQRGNAGLYPEVDISAKAEAVEAPKAEEPKAEPAKAPEAAKPKSLMAENIAKRRDYLDNSPADRSTEKTSGIIDWASTQLERVDAEVAKLDKLVDDPNYDEARHDLVQDLQSDLRALAREAKAKVQNDKDMAEVDKKNGSDLFGGNPDPKSVAAKKAAFLSKVASGDTALLAELSSSTDAKGLQRAAMLLADRAGDLVRTSATELSPEAESALEHSNEVINRVNELARQGNLDWRGDKDGAMKGFLKMLTAVVRGDDRARLNMNTLLGNVDQNSSLPSPALNAAISAKVKGSVKTPLGWYLDAIIADKDTPVVTRAVAEAVAKVARRAPVVGLPTDQMGGAYGLYHQDNGRLNVLNDTDMNLAAIILHEGVHAATTNALTNDPDLHAAVHALLEHVVKHDDIVAASYGATNTLEFLAEGMSNEGFQARLKKIPASSAVRKYLGENVANAWEGFVALVRRALNLRPQDQNALMQLLDLGGRAMQSGTGHTADTDALLESPVISVSSMRKLIGDLFNHGVSPEVNESLQQLTQVVVGNGGGNRLDKMVLEMAKVWTKNNPGVTLEADYLELITDSVKHGMTYPQQTASQAINNRMAELVQDEDVAYGLGTKKYSLESTTIHNDLGRDGFAATHDSPHKFDGKFDWEKNSGRGEGRRKEGIAEDDDNGTARLAGAGTYLSTSEGTHHGYKSGFTATVRRDLPSQESLAELDKRIQKARGKLNAPELAPYRDVIKRGEALPKHLEDASSFDPGAFIASFDHISLAYEVELWNNLVGQRLKTVESYTNGVKASFGQGKSPTYEVSVDIRPEQLLDWNAPLSEQSDLVRAALRKAGFEDTRAAFEKAVQRLEDAKAALKSVVAEERKHYDSKRNDDPFAEPDDLFADVEAPSEANLRFAKLKNAAYAEVRSAEMGVATTDMGDAGDAGGTIYARLTERLGSQAKASIYLRSLGILGNVHNAQGGRESEHRNYVIYDDAKITTNYVKFDKSGTDPTKNNAAGKQPGKDIKSYIEKVLGKSVRLAWANFTHAGEFQRMKAGDIIRLSVHALNPMSTAYHESLHAFIAQLKDAGAHDIVDVLYRAAGSQKVIAQLNEIYKNQPAVLQQLKDPEERAAYMYQVWAANPKALTIGPATRNVFQKLTDFIRSVLGIWSNDERALHIMRYFNDGSYAQSMGTPNATRRALMDPGRNKAVEVAKTFTQPLGKLADALLSTGDARLRDTNIPALNRLADLIKRSGTDTGGDQGYIPAARVAATKQLSAMAETLSQYSPETLTAALNVAQSKGVAGTPEVVAAVQDIRAILRDTKSYMHRAGVKLGDLGPEYFPRVWDTHYISQNEQAFRNMLEPYVRSGEFKGNPSDFIRSLTSRMGNEFGIETSTPGMQFTKKRDLDFLKAEDVAQFLEKDLMGTLGSYITQATRRAEWERRLGGWDEDLKETKLMALMREAKEQGATTDDLKVAGEYLKGVDGTLGDTINPHARRIMGNMIVYQNVRLLPMAMFSMLIDPMGVMVRGGTVSEAFSTFKRGMASIPETFRRKTQADEATRLAELVGVVDAAILSHVMGDVYTQGMVGGTAKKINNAFFKYNMVEGLNRSFRVGASEAAMSFIARHADLKASKHSERWLAELGLQPGDIKMLSSGTGVALAGSTTKNRIALTRAEGLTQAQETRIHAAINQWVDGAMLRPDAADKPIWMNDPHYALISHLKQFVFSFQKTILGRMMHELRHGNYTPAMALASYVPMMIAADTAKGLIQGGGDTPEWKQGWGVSEYVGYGIQRAGLLGVGQFGLDVAEDVGRGGSGFGALSGPTFEQLADAVQLLGGKKQFGPMLLDAMPANALYKESLGGGSDGGPMHAE